MLTIHFVVDPIGYQSTALWSLLRSNPPCCLPEHSNSLHYAPWICPTGHDYGGLLNPKDKNTIFSNAGGLKDHDRGAVVHYIAGAVEPADPHFFLV